MLRTKVHNISSFLCTLHQPRAEDWWTIRDSNPEPTGYEPAALTNWANGPGGPGWNRTSDAQLFRLPLYQLSYRPIYFQVSRLPQLLTVMETLVNKTPPTLSMKALIYKTHSAFPMKPLVYRTFHICIMTYASCSTIKHLTCRKSFRTRASLTHFLHADITSIQWWS